jgi:cystathionine beta-lyase
MFNFDERVDRSGTFSCKWEKYKGKDILPMWIADTEFKVAPAIQQACHTQIEHGVLGYHLPAQHTPANDAVVRWCKSQYNWDIQPSWIVWTPGVCPGFNVAIRAFCQAGDKVLIQTPNYPPILAAPEFNDCTPVHIATVEGNDGWMLDFAELEAQAKDPKVKLFIMCNPMNPVGSVLSQAQLDCVAQICADNDVILCSDEIHCDLILDELTHLPAGNHAQLQHRSITLMAANKTFNIAGLGTSFAIIPDTSLRNAFNAAARGIVPWVNILGLVATQAAFTECDDWHAAQRNYLIGNRDYLAKAINAIEGLKALPAPATFLLWVDASQLDLGTAKNVQDWCESRGVGPSPGVDFGNEQFFRLNFGVSRDMLEEVVARLSA